MIGENIQLWLNIIVLVSLVANTFYTWLTVRHKANKAAINDLSEAVGELKSAVTVLEHQSRTAPTHGDIGRLYERMNVVGGKLENVSGSLDAIKSQLGLISEHLMNGGKR